LPLSARGEQTCAYLYKKGGEEFALLERKAKKVTKHLLVGFPFHVVVVVSVSSEETKSGVMDRRRVRSSFYTRSYLS